MSLAFPHAATFAATWCAIAAWQTYRGFERCQATSGWAGLFWVLQVLFLAAPLLVVGRLQGHPAAQKRRSVDLTLALVVLAYVPILLSMRLLELCLEAG
jgi:hypothetical protein